MLYAKRGNRQIQINKDHQAKYEKLGYVILDISKKDKKLVKKVISKPDDVKGLKAELCKANKVIGELQAQIKILKAK